MSKESERQDRLLRLSLLAEEDGEQDRPDYERRESDRTGPARGPSLYETEDDRRNPEGGRERPGKVEASGAAGRLRDDNPAERPNAQPDGHVHEHHPAPRDELGDEAAGHEAGGAACG